MAIYRLIGSRRHPDNTRVVCVGKTRYYLYDRPYDNKNPEDRMLIERFPGLFTSDVEQATAEPGERRNVKRG